MSKIATIEVISKLEKHPNPEVNSLSIATVLDWEVVVRTENYKVGDKVLFVEPDSVVPEIPEFEFMRKCGFRVRTVKFKGYPSNGLCVPISELSRFNLSDVPLGTSVAELIGIKHYEKPVSFVPGDAKGGLPDGVIKTDEISLYSTPEDFRLFIGKESVATVKIDGSSVSFFLKNGEFGVCSRTLELKNDERSRYWFLAKKYYIEEHMRSFVGKSFGGNLVLQGESAGPGIQGNKAGLSSQELFIFNGIQNGRYWDHDMLFNFCGNFAIPTVPVIWRGIFNFTKEELQKMADDLKYPNGKPAEGIVIRPVVEMRDSCGSRLSRKVVSNVFKLKHNE